MEKAIALFLVFLLVPYLRRKHQEAHEHSKKHMKEGWLKWLVTKEIRIGKRSN